MCCCADICYRWINSCVFGSGNRNPPTTTMAAELTETEIADLQAAFSVYDKDGDGTITAKELETVMRKLNAKPTKSDLQAIINKADVDGNGTIDFSEFLTLMSQHMGDSKRKSKHMDAFRVFDQNGDGFISKTELRRVMSKIGQKVTDEEIDDMIKSVDMNDDGKVNYEEFTQLMTMTP